MKTNRFLNKNVLITGGSSGIGLEVAIEFGKLGANLFLVARNKDRLLLAEQEIKSRINNNINIYSFQADVAQREQIETVINRVANEFGGIHTLINNAGIIICDRFENILIEEMEKVMKINYMGMLYALKAALPHIKKFNDGHIGFVSSVSGFIGTIGYSAYSPSKYAITGLAECVRMEVKEYGIGTTIVFPPDTNTPMLKYENENAIPEVKALKAKAKVISADKVAQKFVKGIIDRRFEVICDFSSKLARIIKGLKPSILYNAIDNIVKKASE
ncbi:MAG: SDR family oxidoreductase [Spirochaetota bacterium]|nr:SDR family oxidoreductase [Spirochaetota bacterium]